MRARSECIAASHFTEPRPCELNVDEAGILSNCSSTPSAELNGRADPQPAEPGWPLPNQPTASRRTVVSGVDTRSASLHRLKPASSPERALLVGEIDEPNAR